MLTLYYKPTCPFCQRVLSEVETMGLKMDLKDVSADEALKAELIEKGGKKQVPYLVDADRGEAMYESSDIIAYLGEHYASSGVRVHVSEEICESCQ